MVTISEAAARLGVSRQRVQQFVSEGRLRASRIGARLCVIEPSELERFKKIPRQPGRKPAKLR